MELTLEQAIQNAIGYEEQMVEAERQLPLIAKEHGEASYQWRQCFRKRNDAKAMLEWYQGRTERDDKGNILYQDIGLIKKLAGEAQRLKERSNLGARFSDRTFTNFDVRRNMQAYQQCKSYAEREGLFTDDRNCLIIYGDVGTGKTHLAASIANHLIEMGIPVLFGTFSDHLEHIREEYDSPHPRKYLSEMKNVPLLVLDDFGKEKRTEWTQQILFGIVNYRYEHKSPFVITTNFNIDGLANYVGTPIFSRLNEVCSAVDTGSGDYRRSV